MSSSEHEGEGARWGALVSQEDFREAQKVDGLCQRVSEWLEAPTGDAGTASGQTFDSHLTSHDGIFLRYIPRGYDDANETPFRTLIPR